MRHCQAVVIGGGCGGLAAAAELKHEGLSDVVLIERDIELGGVLNQCIHNGFGLTTFKEQLSGPAFAERNIPKGTSHRSGQGPGLFLLLQGQSAAP